jgi:DNA-binding SARP family transcriptional activator
MALLVAGEQDQAQRQAAAGLTRSAVVGAHPWRLRLGVIEASALRRGPLLRAAIEHAAEFGALALLETADAIVAGLDLLDPLPAEIVQSAEQWPDVWRSALRRRMAQVPGAQSFAAARFLARIGTLDDAPFLRAFERRSSAAVRSAYLSRLLVERASPTLHVTDLGWTRLSVGGRSVALGEMRRRAASLLVYLIARPRQLAPREKVLDDLWPDLSPQAAANSLNQTLYFLRRDIDPHFEDGVSVDYIRFEAETLGLSPELVTVESVEFHAAAMDTARRPVLDLPEARACIERYQGRFSPEFEYEDWSTDWREQVHTLFLYLVGRTQRELAELGDFHSAIAVTKASLAIDPRNSDLNESLVWLLMAAGSRTAAAEQYAHYAVVHREEVGAEPPSLQDLIRAPLLAPQESIGIRK